MEEKNSEKKERKMRDSGIPWIGEVPEGWEFSKIKYHCTMKSGDNITALDISDNGEYPVYGGNGLRGFYKIYNKNGNHILIGRQGALAGNVHLVNGKFWATDHAVIVTLKNNVFINYFFRMLESMNLNQYAFDTAAQPGLSVSRIMNLNIVLPNLKEQHRIAAFLDSKCSEIDALIENLRARMESAKEYKKAAITEAVTKGLNKDAKMKDSGVEWIREVPEGWKTPKLKNVAILTNGDRGKNYPSGNDLVDEGVYFFTSNNLHNQILDCSREKSKFITEARYNILGGAKIRLNDILFCLRGSVGAAAINKTVESGTIASSLVCITPQNIDADFLNYCLQSNINVIQTNLFMNGSCAANLSAENVGNYYIIEPPISEQHHIANYLDSKCSEIDALLQNYEDQIATLEEYKKSLIYEYVTGKKEVPAA